jgi:hypothetical protein
LPDVILSSIIVYLAGNGRWTMDDSWWFDDVVIR